MDKASGAEIFLERMMEELKRKGAFVPRLVFRNEGVDSPPGQGYDLASLEIEIMTPHQPPEEERKEVPTIITCEINLDRSSFVTDTGEKISAEDIIRSSFEESKGDATRRA